MKPLLELLCVLALLAGVPTAAGDVSQLWGRDGEKWDPAGRLPDFSFAGYHRGEAPLPVVPVVANVKSFGAVGDGKTDDTAAFQRAIKEAKPGAIEIPPGRYVIASILEITRPGIVLRGAGPDKTTLYIPTTLQEVKPNMGATTSGQATSNYSWSGGFIWVRGSFQSSELAKITEAAKRGDKTVRVSSAGKLKMGQTVEIAQQALGGRRSCGAAVRQEPHPPIEEKMSEMKKNIVVGIGEILWDMLPSGKQLGGAVTNFAYHAQALGAVGIIASGIGNDDLGREIISRLAGLHMSTSHLAVDAAHPTGTVEVKLDAKGSPTFIIRESVAWDHIPWTLALRELAGRADCVCFGSLAQRAPESRATIQQFIAATRPDCLRIFDINLRQTFYSRDVIHASLGLANVLKLNDAELPVLRDLLGLPLEEPAAMARLIHRYDLRLIALTRGAAGSRLYTASRCHEHPGHPTTVVDSVGAGDAFTAALAMGLLRNDDPDAINDRASRLASYVCTQHGATPPIPRGL